jgi:hypothetical protein
LAEVTLFSVDAFGVACQVSHGKLLMASSSFQPVRALGLSKGWLKRLVAKYLIS